MAERMNGSLRALYGAYPRTVVLAGVVIVGLVVANTVAAISLWSVRADVARLRSEMNDGERNRADLALRSEENRAKVMAELIRRQARSDRELHLTLLLDRRRLLLERDGIVLREIPVALGRAGVFGTAPDTQRLGAQRGARAVATLVSANDVWDVPAWVFADRRVPVPPDTGRRVKGGLGRSAFVLSDGSVIYSLPSNGPLADSSYVLPGAILIRSEDMRAIAPNITPGLTVYSYE